MIGTPEVDDYLNTLCERARAILDDNLKGIYALGSLALGGFTLGTSDIDVAVIATGRIPLQVKEDLVTSLSHPELPCPTRGLEFVLYPQSTVAEATRTAGFELNLNTGPNMSFSCSFEPATEPPHWFVIDRSIARTHALVLSGPPAREVFSPIPFPWVVGALLDMLSWYRAHETYDANLVLNAARALRYIEERVWSSKIEGATWALERLNNADVVRRALAARGGTGEAPLEKEIDALVDLVERSGVNALQSSQT